MPVGGNRHYTGGGLGEEGMWVCPSCGADNTPPIARGCTACGAGRPGRKAEAPPPPPTLPNAAAPGASYDERQVGQGDVADAWAAQHHSATVAEAYRAGYVDGIRAARAQLATRTPMPPLASDKVARTMVAALALFRDQILADNPEEVTTGEWLSADEVTSLITELLTPEHAHA